MVLSLWRSHCESSHGSLNNAERRQEAADPLSKGESLYS